MQPKKQLTEPKNLPGCGSSVMDKKYYSYNEYLTTFFPDSQLIELKILVKKNLTPDQLYDKLKKEAKKYCEGLK